MEILFELLLGLLQFLLEILLQIASELLARVGVRAIREPWRRSIQNPYLAALGYAGYGALVGALSLIWFPEAFVRSHEGRFANLLLTPLAAGLVMGYLGARRRRLNRETLRMETFTYGFLFAFAMAGIRLIGTR